MKPVILLALGITLCFRAEAQQVISANLGDELILGQGYNTLTGQFAANCMERPDKNDIVHPGTGSDVSPGQMTRWQLEGVESLNQLSERMDFSAHASASFVAGSASASVNYVKSRSFNSFHQYLYLDAVVANSTQIWNHPKLTYPYLAMRLINPIAFLNKCGDAYVKTVVEGGELSAVLDITTTAEEKNEAKNVSLSGSYGSVSGGMDLTTALKETLSSRKISITLVRNGGNGVLPNYDVDALIKASQEFPNMVSKKPIAVLGKLASYNSVTPFDTSLSAPQEAFIRPLFNAYKRSLQIQADYSLMKSHGEQFRVLLDGASKPATLYRLLSSKDVDNGTFNFGPVNPEIISKELQKQEAFTDTLEASARKCLNSKDPQKDCANSSVAEVPSALLGVVRVFPLEKGADMNRPIDIKLDDAYVCKIAGIDGEWSPKPFASNHCTDLQHVVTGGNHVYQDFDTGYYQDNSGVCKFRFVCTRQ